MSMSRVISTKSGTSMSFRPGQSREDQLPEPVAKCWPVSLTLDHHHVDLGLEPFTLQSLRYLQSLHHRRETSSSSHELVFERIKSVEGDIEMSEAGVHKCWKLPLQRDAV